MASSWKVIKGPFISAAVPQEPLVIFVVKSHEKKRFNVESRGVCFVLLRFFVFVLFSG